MIDKVHTLEESMACVKSGQTIMLGGFSMIGVPMMLLKEVERRPINDITLITEDMAFAIDLLPQSAHRLILDHRVKKMIVSFIGNTSIGYTMQEEVSAGNIELEFVPQGTLAERIRCGGMGIGGFYTPTAVGTDLAKGKEVRTINGKTYVLEMPLRADVALIKAHKADSMGNLVFEYTAQNFNPLMAMAADVVIVEADHIVKPGELRPDQIHVPGVFVDYVVQSRNRG